MWVWVWVWVGVGVGVDNIVQIAFCLCTTIIQNDASNTLSVHTKQPFEIGH